MEEEEGKNVKLNMKGQTQRQPVTDVAKSAEAHTVDVKKKGQKDRLESQTLQGSRGP